MCVCVCVHLKKRSTVLQFYLCSLCSAAQWRFFPSCLKKMVAIIVSLRHLSVKKIKHLLRCPSRKPSPALPRKNQVSKASQSYNEQTEMVEKHLNLRGRLTMIWYSSPCQAISSISITSLSPTQSGTTLYSTRRLQ